MSFNEEISMSLEPSNVSVERGGGIFYNPPPSPPVRLKTFSLPERPPPPLRYS